MYGDGSLYGIPGWGNNEDQTYVDSEENIYSSNGCLFIVPTFNEGVGFESARINSSQKRTFLFGRIDVAFSVPEPTGSLACYLDVARIQEVREIGQRVGK